MHELPITLEGLLVLDAIERRGSFAKAAEELNRATSALSYSVQKLEQQLGATLFQRQGRRSVLTASGRLLLDEGRHILAASGALADRVSELARGWEPRLRIGLESTADRPRLFSAVAELLSDHPQLEIDIQECVLSGGWEALEFDRIDLLVGAPGPLPQQKGFRSQPYASDNLLLVVAASHPLAELKDNALQLAAALADARRVVLHDTGQQNVLRSEGLIGGKRLYVETIDQKLQAQLAGLGVGHLPQRLVQSLIDSGQLVALQPEQATSSVDSFYLAWKITNRGRALRRLSELLA